MSLYSKLLNIQKGVSGLGKDGSAYGYQYVTGSKLLREIRPLMDREGVLLKQEVLGIDNTRQDYQTKSGQKSEILSRVMMRFTWIDTETGEKDENLFGANGQNDWEKGLGSALTYAERYFILKYFHIATDEDDIDNPARKAKEEAKAEAERKAEADREAKTKGLLAQALAEIRAAKTMDELKNVWEKYIELQRVQSFKEAVSTAKTNLSKAEVA